MYKQKSALFSLLVLILSFSKLFSQISVVPATGCLPVGITNANFSYTGSGNPTNVVWNYGDGSPAVTLTTTQHSYGNAGTYIVTFNAIIGGSPVTYTTSVSVYPQPNGSINANIPSNHCAPMNVSFTGNSSSSNINYVWAFGDLQVGSGAAPSHAYGAGTYTPLLTIQNTVTGCFVTVSGPTIKVSNLPSVFITANPGFQSCSSPFVTALDGSGSISNSPDGGGLTYSWNLGSFGVSSQASTGNITFQPLGQYGVTLTVTDNNNCSASGSQLVKIETPTVSATVGPTVCIFGQIPSVVQVFTAGVNSNQPSTHWDMGDGTQLTFPPTGNLTPNTAYSGTIHVYTTPGPKVITITATTGQCTATLTKNVWVEKIVPQYTFSAPSFYCNSPASISFTNMSTLNSVGNSLTYTWSVPGWGTAPTQFNFQTNPTFNLYQGSINIYADYSHPPYIVSPHLFVMSQPVGCTAQIVYVTDTIQRLNSQFEVSSNEGCAPLSVTFSNTSVSSWTVPPLSPNYTVTPNPILSYTWNFGGTAPNHILTGSTTGPAYAVPPPSYVYTVPGVYYPTLTIQTALGCTATSIMNTITVVNPPTLSATIVPSLACAGTSVHFNLSSSQNVDHWHVDTDAGYYSSCITNAGPNWMVDHVGTHDYTVSGYYQGCKGQLVVPGGLKVMGPKGSLTYETNCATNKKMINFNYYLEDVLNATLDFGDGSPAYTITSTANTTVNAAISHTYATAGDYTAILLCNNSGNACGTYTCTRTVQVRDPHADFNFVSPVVCLGANVSMDAATAIDSYSTNCALSYIWYLDNLPPETSSSPAYTPTTALGSVGNHSIKLVVKDVNGCKDEITKSFRVSSPSPDFTFNANPMCFSNQPVIFNNITSQTPDAVTQYTFYAGDSILYTPPFLLPYPYHTVFTNTTLSNYSPSFTYPSLNGGQTLSFTVTLFAKNIYGCESMIRKVLTINDPLINIAAPYRGCAPTAALVFTVNAANTHTNYTIDWGDGTPTVSINSYSTNNQYLSVHNFANTGTFIPVFTLTDFGGCKAFQTVSPVIIETAPVTSFTFFNNSALDHKPGPGPFCAPFGPFVTSTTQSPFGLIYNWNLGDGNIQPAGTNSTAGTVYGDVEGTFIISLTASTSIAFCASTYSVPVVLLAPHINFAITPDSLKKTYCLGEPITFSVTSHKNSQYYQWDFGDGAVTNTILVNNFTLKTQYTPTFFPVQTNGTFTVLLTGYAATGTNQASYTVCKEKQTMVINLIRALPAFNRNNELTGLDTAHCVGRGDQFKNLSITNSPAPLSYTWSLGDGKTEYGTDVSHIYTPGTYTVKLTVAEPIYSCTATLSKKMVIFPNPKAEFIVDTFSCPGKPFVLSGSGSPGVSGTLTGTLMPGPTTVSFTPSNSFSLNATASVSTTYSLQVRDNNGCEIAAPTKSIYIQQPAPIVNWDTTIVIGQSAPLNAYAGSGFSYTWTPLVSYLNCSVCSIYNPVSTTTADITYSVMVQDGHQCSVVANTYKIHVEIKVSLDVPTAFTPNGDGTNDIILPGGWGLRKLNYFKVFNRWGQLVFETNDLSVGWDGVFQGVPQNIETYVYQVSADTYSDKEPTLSKTGTFKLLR